MQVPGVSPPHCCTVCIPLRLSCQQQLLLCVVNYKAYVHLTVIERTLLYDAMQPQKVLKPGDRISNATTPTRLPGQLIFF
jgi:hypothetical protein